MPSKGQLLLAMSGDMDAVDVMPDPLSGKAQLWLKKRYLTNGVFVTAVTTMAKRSDVVDKIFEGLVWTSGPHDSKEAALKAGQDYIRGALESLRAAKRHRDVLTHES
jgi:hypothetical protein